MQSPGGTREELAKKLKLKAEDVIVNFTLLGGGFGRKSQCDYVIEAAILAKAMKRPGQGDLDARGRHPSRLFPHRVVRAHRCRYR